jgi:hypothetical protein
MYMRHLIEDVEADMKARQEEEWIELLHRPDALPLPPRADGASRLDGAMAGISGAVAHLRRRLRRRSRAAGEPPRVADATATRTSG